MENFPKLHHLKKVFEENILKVRETARLQKMSTSVNFLILFSFSKS